jgi:hypothetical protein
VALYSTPPLRQRSTCPAVSALNISSQEQT